MKVFLLKDVPQVGKAEGIVTVSEGFARNFLFPRKLAVEVTSTNESSFVKRLANQDKKEAIIATKTSQLAEEIKAITLVVKRRSHDGELYAPIRPVEIVDLLAQKGFAVAKNQVILDKTIKTVGLHSVIIKLSSQLQPAFHLKVVAE